MAAVFIDTRVPWGNMTMGLFCFATCFAPSWIDFIARFGEERSMAMTSLFFKYLPQSGILSNSFFKTIDGSLNKT